MAENEWAMTKEQEETATTMSNLALMGDSQRLREMASRQNVNWRDRWGQTPLLRAAWAGEFVPTQGHADCARLLLGLGADPGVRDPDEVTALHWTAESENLAVLRLLVEAGADINSRDKRGLSPLMLASWRGNLKAVRELMQLGCDPQLRDKDGDTAASLAEMYEHRDVVRLLANWSDGAEKSRVALKTDGDEERHFLEQKKMETFQPQQTCDFQLSSLLGDVAGVGHASSVSMLNRSHAGSQLHNVYPVTEPQGHCVIINIENYDPESKFSRRVGSRLDVRRVKRLFKSLNFKVWAMQDLTGDRIFWELSDFARADHTQMGTFVCFLMAHGTKGAIYGRDGQFQSLRELVALFQPGKCHGLERKPKLFFVQACRGADSQHPEPPPDVQRDGNVPVTNPLSCPNEADFLICYANTEDSPAYRDPNNGSIFIQTLCDVIEEQHETEYLEDMILEVNNRVTSRPIPDGDGAYFHAVVEKTGRLSRKVSFNPHAAA